MPDVYIDSKPEKKKEKVEETPQKRNHNPLSSYCYLPRGINFINMEKDEKVILLTRRHFLTNVGWLLLVIAMLFAPLILNYFPLLNFLPANFQVIATLFWYLLTLAIFLQGFLTWFYSVNIVTDRRVVDVDFENLIYRKITDAKIGNIEDVTVAMGSVVRTIFNFGDVFIQTAAEIPEVEFLAVPFPDRIVKLLSELRLKQKH